MIEKHTEMVKETGLLLSNEKRVQTIDGMLSINIEEPISLFGEKYIRLHKSIFFISDRQIEVMNEDKKNRSFSILVGWLDETGIRIVRKLNLPSLLASYLVYVTKDFIYYPEALLKSYRKSISTSNTEIVSIAKYSN